MAGTSGGVIFFSTQGDRSPADEMGGGDFDGDKYLIMYGDNVFVSPVQQVEAYVDESQMPNGASTATVSPGILDSNEDTVGWEILEDLIRSSQNCYLGRYSNAWIAWADQYGPDDCHALECDRIARIAVDAAKTGIAVPFSHFLLTQQPKPHYAARHSSNCRNSTSIVGVLYNMVEDSASSAAGNQNAAAGSIHLDGDLLRGLDGYNVYQIVNGHECMHLHRPYLDYWLVLYDRYRGGLAEVLSRMDCGGNDQANELRSKFGLTFDECAREICFEHHQVGHVCRPVRNEVTGEEGGVTCCLLQHSDGQLLTARFRLAGIVYAVTYTKATVSSITGKIPLSFCWEVCGKELHYIKRVRSMTRQGQHSLDGIPASEKEYLF